MRLRIAACALATAIAAAPAVAAVRLLSRTVAEGERSPLAGTAAAAAAAAGGPVILVGSGPVTESVRRSLAGIGVASLAYVPDDSLLVRVAPEAWSALARHPWPRGFLSLSPTDKLSPRVGVARRGPDGRWPGALTVQVAAGTDLDALMDRTDSGLAVSDLVVIRRGGAWPRLVVAAAPERERDTALALAALAEVVWIEPAAGIDFANDTSVWVCQSWDGVGLTTPVHDRGLHGEGQLVAVADTGLDADHASFYDASQGLPTRTPNPLQRKVIAYHDQAGTGDGDSDSHGTHVAGTVAGDLDGDGGWDANAAGQAPDGMAPAAKLVVYDLDTFYDELPIDLGEFLGELHDDGARLFSNSWRSCFCPLYTAHSQDVDDFAFAHPDATIFYCAGNEGPGAGTLNAPASAKNAVAVAATERGSAADQLAWFSSRGPATDGRNKPDLAAPGVDIVSAMSDFDLATFNDGAAAKSGTSMATPTAAGMATLVRQYLVEGFHPTGAPTPADAIAEPPAALVKALLVNSARSMLGHPPAPTSEQGWGRILLDDALHFAGDARKLWLVHDDRGLAWPGQSRRYRIAVGPAAEELRVTLVWTDPGAATFVNPNLVNDLDLVVEGPGGTWLGNVFAGGLSQPGGAADRLNVEEGVRLAAPPSGVWTLTVAAANVPFGPQPFALVATGDVGPAAHLSVESWAAVEVAGDGDGQPEPGESFDLSLLLREDGGAAASGVVVTATALVPWARVTGSAALAFPDAPARGTTGSPAPWRVEIDPAAPCGASVPFALAIATDQGAMADGAEVATGFEIERTVTVFADDFDSVASGAPPDPARWQTGFVDPPPPGIQAGVAADDSIEPPAATTPPTPANALRLARSGTAQVRGEPFAATGPLDLAGHDAATLEFDYWMRSLEGGSGFFTADRFFVEGSLDGGATFPILLHQDRDWYWSGTDSAALDGRWQHVRIDLARAGLLRSGVALRFHASLDDDEVEDAVYIDRVRIEASSLCCDGAAFTLQAAPSPACFGAGVDLTVTVGQPPRARWDGEWDFGDGDRRAVSPFDAAVTKAWGLGGSWAVTLTAADPAHPRCGAAAATTVEVDEPAGWTPAATSPVCVASPRVTLSATPSSPGHGPASWSWDPGDGSPVFPLADPALPVVHDYPPVPALWVATLTGSADRVAGCAKAATVTVEVVAAAPPAGQVGNDVRAVRAGGATHLDWTGAAVVPRRYNVHRTAAADRLVEIDAVLGQEPIVAAPDDVESLDDAPPAASTWFYEVVARDGCTGRSVLP